VDSRRGVSVEDQELIAWADPLRRHVHVLLAKIDKLKRNEATAALKAARTALDPRVSVQAFSAHAGTGLREAQKMLGSLLGEKKETPMALQPPGLS
jgi:GTP-binding protein EngB required for normal cell division